MTREEAIRILKDYAQYSFGIWHNDEEDTKAFDMAIEALEREIKYGQMVVDLTKGEKVDDWVYDEDESATTTDLISRQAAIDAIESNYRKMGLSHNDGAKLEKMLKALPSADTDMSEYSDRLWKAAYERGKASGNAVPKSDQYKKGFEDAKRALLIEYAREAAERTGEWIPVSERLPSNSEQVIISVCDDHGDTPYNYTTVGWRCEKCWISDNDYVVGDVLAWMPLPEPYKGGDAE